MLTFFGILPQIGGNAVHRNQLLLVGHAVQDRFGVNYSHRFSQIAMKLRIYGQH